jgi:glycosyltransferase involved in cell wall biosynthesis
MIEGESRPNLNFEQTQHETPEYMFLNPDTLLSPETKHWLATHTVGHVSPLWLAKSRELRRYGGAEDVVLNIINGLDDYAVKGQFMCGNADDKVLEERLANFTVHYPDVEAFHNLDLYSMLQNDPYQAVLHERFYVADSYIALEERKEALGVVHDHTSYGLDQAVRITPYAPVVRTEHGPMIRPYLSGINEAHLHRLKDKTPNQWFIAISQDQYESRPDLPWIAIVHNGVDMRDFDFAEEKQGHPEYGQYLLFLGRISPEKGAHEAIAIAEELEIPLIIAGHVEQTKSSLEYFETEIEPNLGSNIHYDFPQGANQEERRVLMRDASAFLMPISWHEPFGMTMVEALASGTPVVVNNIGSGPEVVEHGVTGYVADSLEDAFIGTEAMLNGQYDPFACRRSAEFNFSRHVMAAKYAQVYAEAAKRFNGESQETGIMVFPKVR